MMAMERCSLGAAGLVLHQGWFLLFNYHCGTAKFDMKIFDGTQCQKKYEAEVHFH
jgi:hypothetical protein